MSHGLPPRRQRLGRRAGTAATPVDEELRRLLPLGAFEQRGAAENSSSEVSRSFRRVTTTISLASRRARDRLLVRAGLPLATGRRSSRSCRRTRPGRVSRRPSRRCRPRSRRTSSARPRCPSGASSGRPGRRPGPRSRRGSAPSRMNEATKVPVSSKTASSTASTSVVRSNMPGHPAATRDPSGRPSGPRGRRGGPPRARTRPAPSTRGRARTGAPDRAGRAGRCRRRRSRRRHPRRARRRPRRRPALRGIHRGRG